MEAVFLLRGLIFRGTSIMTSLGSFANDLDNLLIVL